METRKPAAVDPRLKTLEGFLRNERHRATSLARRVLGSNDDAEDAVGDATAKAIEALNSYDPSQPFSSWFLTIVRNRCIDTLRRRQRAAAIDTVPLLESDGEEGEHGEADPGFDGAEKIRVSGFEVSTPELARALLALPPFHRSILRAHYAEGRELADIASEYSVSAGMVKVWLRQAREALGKSLNCD